VSAAIRLLAGVLIVLLATYWASVGLGKIAGVLMTTDATMPSQWSDQFPSWLIVGVAACEVSTAILMVLGRPRTGLVLGLTMLAVFSAALLLVPIRPGQPCGCGGLIDNATDPIIRNGFFASLHVLALVLNQTARKPRQVRAELAH
jgi:uncharacterized membrane protein YphA (DoxX/SURF4 family)